MCSSYWPPGGWQWMEVSQQSWFAALVTGAPLHSAVPPTPPQSPSKGGPLGAAKLAVTHLSCNKSFKLLIVWSPKKCKPKDYSIVSCSLASAKRISAELWSNCIHYCYLLNSTLGILVGIIYIKVMNLISQYINKKHLIWVKMWPQTEILIRFGNLHNYVFVK